jgi:hypothetical protein
MTVTAYKSGNRRDSNAQRSGQNNILRSISAQGEKDGYSALNLKKKKKN